MTSGPSNSRSSTAGSLLTLTLLAGTLHAQAPSPSPQPPPAPAATAQPDTPDQFESRPIRSIRIFNQAAPADEPIDQLVRNQLRTLEGTPFRRQTIEEDIGRLNRLGRFRTIRSEVLPLADGSVDVIYTVTTQPTIQDVQVVGNRELNDQELLKAIAIPPNAPVDRFQIDRAARALEDLYRSRGFADSKVRVDERELAESAIVVFRIVEGQRVRVTALQFEGNASFTRSELLSAVKTRVYIPILDKAPLDDEAIRNDVANLAKFYRDRGYLDARTSVRITPSPNGKEAAVVFLVDEGPLYTLRSLKVLYTTPDALEQYKAQFVKDPRQPVGSLTPEQMRQIGRNPFTPEELAGIMSLKPGDAYADNKLRASIRAIEDAYGKLGYILDQPPFETVTARITPREIRDDAQPQIDLILFITEGKPYTLGQIVIGKNESTKQQVILRDIDLKPDRPLDISALDESQRRLEARRFFAPGKVRAQVRAPDPKDPTRRDVFIETPETNTGEINFGASVDSDGGLIGQFSVVQRNFDLFDTPKSVEELITGNSFRGAGQRFEIALQPGDRVQDYRINLTDPNILETDYSLGGSVFFRKRRFDEYDEQRYGGNVSLSRRFGPIWEGGLVLRNEWVDLSNIPDNAPQDYFDSQDRQQLTGVGLTLVRNTTNDRFRPSAGSRLQVSAERVFASKSDFTRLGLEYATFFNVYESFLGYRTILKLNTATNYIPEGQSKTPVFERYYLGGRSFRGFGSRAVSPIGLRPDGTDSGEPVGGTFSFFLGAEIQQPVYEDIISVVGFIDSGTVDTKPTLDKYRVSVGTGIRIAVPALSPVPLAFDIGFPVLKEPSDRKRIFTFAVDIPF